MKNLSSVALLPLLVIGLAVSAAEKIDINTASRERLEEIIWVGPVIAQRIIDARPFYSVDELIKVKGIGEKKLADIKAQGLAWVGPNLEPPPEVALPEQSTEKAPVSPPQPPTQRAVEPAQEGLAAAAQPFTQEYPVKEAKNPLPVFLTALALAILSGAAILMLKNQLKNTYNKDVR